MSEVVQVLIIEHRHGRDVSVWRTPEAAQASLAAYCAEWWSEIRERTWTQEVPATMPDDPEELIQTYFALAPDEWWGVEACTVTEETP